jgi:HPr kinase/phosphorylase
MIPLRESLHASLVILGETGVLIRGRSGAGKSALALALLARAGAAGWHARLVGDDRVLVEVAGGRLVGRGHAAVRGLIEARGTGILTRDTVEHGVISAVVTLEASPARLPAEDAGTTEILGLPLRQMILPDDRDLAAKADLVFGWLQA